MRGILFTKSPRWAEASGDADCVPTPWSISGEEVPDQVRDGEENPAARRGSFRVQRSRIKSGTAMGCVPTPWSILAPMAGWNPALREGGSC